VIRKARSNTWATLSSTVPILLCALCTASSKADLEGAALKKVSGRMSFLSLRDALRSALAWGESHPRCSVRSRALFSITPGPLLVDRASG
jgi:hypothetical protein